MADHIRRLLRKDGFARGAITLMTGTTLAQAIPIAISPILTRLFTPEDYGVFALYTALVAFLSTGAAGRYELAIMLPESDDDADALVVLSAAIAAGFSLVLLVIVLFARDVIAEALGQARIAPWLFLLPVSVALAASYNALNYWLNRRRNFRRMSTNRVLQAGLGGALQIGFGASRIGGLGLILGQFLAVMVTTGQIAASFLRQLGPHQWTTLPDRLRTLIIRYKNHPTHLLPSHLIGAAALQLPLLAVSGLFGATTAGLYAFAYRLMVLPTSVIASALGDVYRQRASVAYRETGDFRRLFLLTLVTTAAIGAVPVVIFIIIAPTLFAVIFGEPWRVAGDYARILAVAAYFQFVFTPVDKGALIVGATRYILAWHVLRLIGIAGVFLAGWLFSLEVEKTLAMFVIVNIFVYLLDGIVEYRLSRISKVGEQDE